MGLTVFFVVLALGLVLAAVIYNQLVTLRNRCKNAFAQIDVQLQRRYDLIPNLVEAAKAYLSHERETLTNVIAARNQAASARAALGGAVDNADAMQRLATAEGALSGALGRLLAVSESYPELKADTTIAQLMEELSSTENRVGFARQAYNDAVMGYNVSRESFPNLFVAGFFQFREAPLLEIPNPEARQSLRINMH